MNFYDVLQLQPTATREQIKESYKRLAKTYHPDKNGDADAIDNFRNVQSAYEILYDDNKRKEYDKMTSQQKVQLYNALKNYLVQKAPNYTTIYEKLVQRLYGDEKDLQHDVDTLNLNKIYHTIFSAIQEGLNINNTTLSSTESNKSKQLDLYPVGGDSCGDNEELDVECTISTNFEDRYLNRYKKVVVPGGAEHILPLRDSIVFIKEGGRRSTLDPDKVGDLTVKIVCNIPINYEFQPFNKYDLVVDKVVSVYEYFYGGKLTVTLPSKDKNNPDKEVLLFSSCTDKAPLFKIPGRGNPYMDDGSNSILRGDLYVFLKVKEINDGPSDTTTQQILKRLFPPLHPSD